MKYRFVKFVFCCVVLSLAMGAYAQNSVLSRNASFFEWPDKRGIPARDAILLKNRQAAAVQMQKGDTIWLRKAYEPILIYGDSEVQPEYGVACVENYFDMELEDSGRRLVVCQPEDADYVGIIISTSGGVTTLRGFTAGSPAQLYATLHVTQTAVAEGDTLTFSGRQTYFYPDNKIMTLKMYKPDGTFDFSVDYDKAGTIVRTVHTGDTLQYIEYYPSGSKRMSLTWSPGADSISWLGYTPAGRSKDNVEVNIMSVTNDGLMISALVTPALPANGYADLVTGRLTHNNMLDWISIRRKFQLIRSSYNEPAFIPVMAQRYSRDEDKLKSSPLTQYLKHKTNWRRYFSATDTPIKQGCFSFVVDKSNSIRDVQVQKSSGVADFDNEIVKAIKEIPICSKGGIWSRPLGSENETITAHDYEVRFYIVPTTDGRTQSGETRKIVQPDTTNVVHAGDSLWLTEIFDDSEIFGDYSLDSVYGKKMVFRVAYADLERIDQWNRLRVSNADKGQLLGIVDSVDYLGVALRVYRDVSCQQLHSMLHVNKWSMHEGDTLIPNGRQTYYYPTGEIKCERHFKDTGVFESEKTYDLSGRMINSQSRKDTVVLREFYPSGKLRQTYTFSPSRHKERWDSYDEDGNRLKKLFYNRLALYDDGVYIEYESTPSIPAGELPDTEVAQADYTIDRPVKYMHFHTSNMLPMALHPLWKEGRWRDKKEKYLIPRAYFTKNTGMFDAFALGDTIQGSYSCIVDHEGRIQTVTVDRSVGVDSLDREMVEAIRNMPIYSPGAIVRRKVGADVEEHIPHTYRMRFMFYTRAAKVSESVVMPEFPGGVEALKAYLNANVKYPKLAQQNGIQGRTVCQIVVDTDGTITDITILRSSHDANLDAEAVRVIRAMPKWSPALRQGKPVRAIYTIPVNFRLK